MTLSLGCLLKTKKAGGILRELFGRREEKSGRGSLSWPGTGSGGVEDLMENWVKEFRRGCFVFMKGS